MIVTNNGNTVENLQVQAEVAPGDDAKCPGGVYILAILNRKDLKHMRIGINNFYLHLASSAGTRQCHAATVAVSLSLSVAS